MRKGVAVKTLFLIVVIGIMIFFSLVLLWHYMENQGIAASKVACTIKYMNYCERCIKDKACPNDWSETAPDGCDKFDIEEPMLEQCQLGS